MPAPLFFGLNYILNINVKNYAKKLPLRTMLWIRSGHLKKKAGAVGVVVVVSLLVVVAVLVVALLLAVVSNFTLQSQAWVFSILAMSFIDLVWDHHISNLEVTC